MTLPNLGGHTAGGTITEGQDTKEDTSNDLDGLLDNNQNHPSSLSVTAGGTFNFDTPQGSLDQYLESATIRIIGTPAAPFTIIIPDGDKKTSWVNETGQTATIDTVTGATPPVTLPGASIQTVQARGIEFTVTGDNSNQTGAMLASGATPATGSFDWADQELARASFKDYAEEKTSPASVTGTLTLDLETGNVFEVTLTENTTFVFSNPPITGDAGSFTLITHQDGTGGWTVAWPTSVDWEIGSAPQTSTGVADTDLFSFMTVDAGTVWFGFTAGLNFG